MLLQCTIRALRSCVQTLNPTTPRLAGQICASKAGGRDNTLHSAAACGGTPRCAPIPWQGLACTPSTILQQTLLALAGFCAISKGCTRTFLRLTLVQVGASKSNVKGRLWYT
eukprot:1176281-Rhodomonas_salina.1